jgi:hypothetical protein
MNTNLTWQDKFVRLSELDPNIALKNGKGTFNGRPTGRTWFISSQLRIFSQGTSTKISASGASAEQAVENFWEAATNYVLPPDAALIIGLDDKSGFRWHNYKWSKVNLGATV